MAKRKTTWRGLRAAFRKGVGDARTPGRAFYSGFGKSQTREHLAYQRGYAYVARGRSAAIRRSGARPLQWNPAYYGFSPGGPSNVGKSVTTVRAHMAKGRPVRQHVRHLSVGAKTILGQYRSKVASGFTRRQVRRDTRAIIGTMQRGFSSAHWPEHGALKTMYLKPARLKKIPRHVFD